MKERLELEQELEQRDNIFNEELLAKLISVKIATAKLAPNFIVKRVKTTDSKQ